MIRQILTTIFGGSVRVIFPPRFTVQVHDDSDGGPGPDTWCWVSDTKTPKGHGNFEVVHCCVEPAQATLIAHELNKRHPHVNECMACPKCWHDYRTNLCDKVCHCAAYRIARTIPDHKPTIYQRIEGRDLIQ